MCSGYDRNELQAMFSGYDRNELQAMLQCLEKHGLKTKPVATYLDQTGTFAGNQLFSLHVVC